MSSRDEEWWNLQAGELVLGTLDNHERELFESIRQRDPEFSLRVVKWQERLAPLDQLTKAVQPPAHVLESIESQLGFTPDEADLEADFETDLGGSILNQTSALENVQDAFDLDQLSEEYSATPTRSATIDEAQSSVAASKPRNVSRNINIWRDLTFLATAACLVLSFVLWNKHYESTQKPLALTEQPLPQFDAISLVADDNAVPLWVINADTESNQVQISAFNPPPPGEQKSYQLWLVKPDNTGVSSMGLLPHKPGQSIMLTAPLLGGEAVAFAVSLEPAGGSPAAVPTGPVLYQGEFQKLNTPGNI